MITAVDTNVLLDIFLPDPKFGPASQEAIEVQFKKGSLLICDIVYAELAAFFAPKAALEDILFKLGIRFSPLSDMSAFEAGNIWKKYARRSGRGGRVLADFLIGAHGQHQADVLLTRDRGFYRDYFPALNVIAP